MATNLKYLSEYIFGISNPNKEEWEINPFTLTFKGNTSKYESEFKSSYFKSSIKPFRLSLLLGILLYSAFAILDIILFPEFKNSFFIIRFGLIVPIMIIVYIISFTDFFEKTMQVIATATIVLTSLGLVSMIIISAETTDNYSYYTGIILILFFGYSFSKIRFKYGFIAGWLIIISYEVVAIWITPTPDKILINNNFFFISANVIGMLISYHLELTARWNFYLQILLQKERLKVVEANNKLEERVKDRTHQLTTVNKELKKEIAKRKRYKSEKAALESQLFQLHKMETVGTLAGGIAHDFNNILTPIIGYAGMALDDLPDNSHLKEDIEQIHSAASRGKDLIQKILTFSRQIDYDKKPLQLHNIINEVVDLLKVTMPSNVEVKKELDADAGTILADRTQMHQVIMNLAVNSWHAMIETGGVLEFRLRKKHLQNKHLKPYKNLSGGIFVILTVSDTGHGMDSETMCRIFEPFFTNKEVGEGTGLGLSVVHGIIKNHNGFITVDSKIGKGTTFTICLPHYSKKGT